MAQNFDKFLIDAQKLFRANSIENLVFRVFRCFLLLRYLLYQDKQYISIDLYEDVISITEKHLHWHLFSVFSKHINECNQNVNSV